MRELDLDNYRRRKRWASCTAAEKKALAEVAEELETAEEEEGQDTIELIDVIDAKSGDTIYLFALWPFGSGVLVDLAKKEVVADVVQHSFDARGDRALREGLAAVWTRKREALGVRESVGFEARAGEDEPKAKTIVGGALERIEAMRASMRQGSPADPQAVWALLSEVFDFKKKRPLPARRPSDLDAPTRAMLELILDGYEGNLGNIGMHGLPANRDEIARFIGRAPAGPLDVLVMLDGSEHPAWCLVSDAVHEVRPQEKVVAALAALPSDAKTAILRALTLPIMNVLVTGGHRPPPKGAQPSSPAARGESAQRFLRFVLDFAARLGNDAEKVAKEILAARGDWLAKWLPQLTTRPGMSVPHWSEQCIALAVLAQAAKNAGSALDPAWDALLSALARCNDATYPLAIVLEHLPSERATKIACADLLLIEKFPSVEGATPAIERFEASGGGPYMNALFERVITAIGPGAAPALEAAIARESPQKKVIAKCLAKVGKSSPKPKKAKRTR